MKPKVCLHGDTQAADHGSEQTTYLCTLNRLLIRAVKALGNAGESVAAEVWAALREQSPDEAERLSGAVHYLTRSNLRPRKET